MKTKHFYTHLAQTTEITLEIANLDVSPSERMHLFALMEANIHSAVISSVLSTLETEDKKIFLQNLSGKDHKKTWAHLKQKIQNAEDEIRETIIKTTKGFLKDIKEVKS